MRELGLRMDAREVAEWKAYFLLEREDTDPEFRKSRPPDPAEQKASIRATMRALVQKGPFK